MAHGRREQGLYVLEMGISRLVAVLNAKGLKIIFDLWHLRLRHVPLFIISQLNKLGHLLVSSILQNPTLYSSCQLSKSKHLSFALNEKRATCVLDMIHCDVQGPALITTSDDFRYYVAFVDDFHDFLGYIRYVRNLSSIMFLYGSINLSAINFRARLKYFKVMVALNLLIHVYVISCIYITFIMVYPTLTHRSKMEGQNRNIIIYLKLGCQ